MTVDNRNPSATARQVEINAGGLAVPDSSVVGGKRQVAFSEIDVVLLSADQQLSFQIGREVFSVRVNPQNPKHMQVIEKLIQSLRSTTSFGG